MGIHFFQSQIFRPVKARWRSRPAGTVVPPCFFAILRAPHLPWSLEIMCLESAILTMVAGNSPDPRWSGQLCAKAFTERLRILMQRLTTTTDDPLPLFVRIADADPRLRSLPFRTAASWEANREIVFGTGASC